MRASRFLVRPLTSVAATALLLAACSPASDGGGGTGNGDGGDQVDTATVDQGAPRNPAGPEGGPPTSALTLPGGAQVQATPSAAALQAYLASGEAAGRRFALPELRFVKGMELREDPNGSLATLTAILNAYPNARVRVEVLRPNPQDAGGNPDAEGRAELVAQALVRNGLAANRVTSAAAQPAEGPDAPFVQLVVTAK